jgi:hypothetical protein
MKSYLITFLMLIIFFPEKTGEQYFPSPLKFRSVCYEFDIQILNAPLIDMTFV